VLLLTLSEWNILFDQQTNAKIVPKITIKVKNYLENYNEGAKLRPLLINSYTFVRTTSATNKNWRTGPRNLLWRKRRLEFLFWPLPWILDFEQWSYFTQVLRTSGMNKLYKITVKTRRDWGRGRNLQFGEETARILLNSDSTNSHASNMKRHTPTQ